MLLPTSKMPSCYYQSSRSLRGRSRYTILTLFLFSLILIEISNVAPALAAASTSFRVPEDATIVRRCVEETLNAPKDPSADFRLPSSAKLRSAAKGEQRIIYIPLVFHICRLTDGIVGNVPVDSLLKGLSNLNEAYAGLPDINGDKVDTNIRFFLQGIVYWDNNDYFMSCEGLEATIKARTAVRQDSVLNVYTCRLPALGFAYLPWTDEKLHGVVINFMTFPGNSQEDPYYFPFKDFNKAYTLVHEVGHTLGLEHTFEGGCSRTSSIDTEPEAMPYYGSCDPLRPETVAPDSCPGGDHDPINNFMDYSMDACMLKFTPGQVQRIHSQLFKFKPAMAMMANSLFCYADGLLGTAHKYAICNTTLPLSSRMPNGESAPSRGWCFTHGFPRLWGTVCCPGSCSDFGEVAPLFPPLGETRTFPTESPTRSPAVAAVLDPRLCNRPSNWAEANKSCRKKRMRLCSSAEIRSGALRRAVVSNPNCTRIIKRTLWTNSGCGSSAAVTIKGNGARVACERRTRRYFFLCCR